MAADIDLLVALSGDGTVRSKMTAVQQAMGQFRAGVASGAIAGREMSDAFRELSDTGSLSVTSVSQLGAVIPSLASPVGIAAAAIGFLTSEMIRMNKEAKEARDEFTKVLVKDVQDDVSRRLAAVAATAGATGKEAELLRKIVELDLKAAEAAKLYNGTLNDLASTTAQNGLSMNTLEEDLKGTGEAYLAHSENIIRQKALLEAELAALRALNKERGEEVMVIEERRRLSEDVISGMLKEWELEQELIQDADAAITISMLRISSVAKDQIAGTAVDAFDAYADALDKTVSMNALASASLDRTFRNIAASSIRNIGRQAAVEGSMEAARALAALALRDFDAAAKHGAAAGAFFGVAALAGAAAGATSVKGGGGGGAGGGRGGGDGFSGPSGPNVSVTVIGNLDDSDAQELGRRIRRAMSRGDA